MKMSLPEEKISSGLSLSRKSYGIAIENMVLGVLLWTALDLGLSAIDGLKSSELSSASFVLVPLAFIMRTTTAVLASLVPTLVGAKILSIWLQRNHVTQKSAMIAGAVTGITTISLLTIPISIGRLRFHGTPLSSILLFALFNLPIAICAALAGGRTGLQFAKFMEAQPQNPAEVV